jgi:P pilus assembly chaperone PapD
MMTWRAAMTCAGLTYAALLSLSAHALYLDSTIYDMAADKPFMSKRIFNDSKKQNVYSISAVKIDKPGPGGERRESIKEGELLFAPLNFSLAPDAGEYFKIFYRGPQDDKERYYRVQFTEMPVTLFPERNTGKKSEAIPAIALDTILVVRPRKVDLRYTLDEQAGILKNTGNTFLKSSFRKDATQQMMKQLFVMYCQETYNSPGLKSQNKKFIVALQKYLPIGNGCFKRSS